MNATDIEWADLAVVLHAGAAAAGTAPGEAAAAGLLVELTSWLTWPEFRRHIDVDLDGDPPRPVHAWIRWADAIAALDAGEFPFAASSMDRTLRLAASLAGAAPVNLSQALPGLDLQHFAAVVRAIATAAGRRTTPAGDHATPDDVALVVFLPAGFPAIAP